MTHYVTYFVKPDTATVYSLAMFKSKTVYATEVKPAGEGWYKVTRKALPAEVRNRRFDENRLVSDIADLKHNLAEAIAMKTAMKIARRCL